MCANGACWGGFGLDEAWPLVRKVRSANREARGRGGGEGALGGGSGQGFAAKTGQERMGSDRAAPVLGLCTGSTFPLEEARPSLRSRTGLFRAPAIAPQCRSVGRAVAFRPMT